MDENQIALACRPAFEKYPVVCAYLFGFRARGTHRPDSDFDLAVVCRPSDEQALALDLEQALEQIIM